MSFKECYWHIPPHMYDDVRAHIQEMLDIGVIQKLHSPWASAVVLVWKKDTSLRFCIDLRKLNNQTIKDVYSLPHIDEILDSLQGSQWFSSLDMKLGYWQVKMDEESKPLIEVHHRATGLLWVQKDAFCTQQCHHYFPEANGDLSWGPQSPLVYCLPKWYSHLLQGSSQPPWEARGCVPVAGGGWTQTQAI